MSLLEMSASGGVLILAVIVLRALALHRLPKGTFLALWAVAVLRLLLPFSLPSPASVYTLADRWVPAETARTVPDAPSEEAPAGTAAAPAAPVPAVLPASPAEKQAPRLSWGALWLAGTALCGAWFLTAYVRCRREFRTALPVEDQRLTAALDRRLRRPVALRQSDRIAAPLTYGVLRPVILLPASTDWSDAARLACVLDHELTHIRRFDSLAKLALAAAACVHWFNPLVWCMYALANRDIELSCDEAVVRRLGVDRRSEYAMALIAMEERKSGLGPFASAFSKNAIEERITAIMKMKKQSLAAILAAVLLICGLSAAFATSAAESNTPYPHVEDGAFTKEELDRLASLWFQGYEDMTVADYRQKMCEERDDPAGIALIERYGQSHIVVEYWQNDEATERANAFDRYFYDVYEPLTAEVWQKRSYSGAEAARLEDGSAVLLEYTYTLHILAPDTLTVGEYQQARASVQAGVAAMLGTEARDEDFEKLSRRLSTGSLAVTVEGMPVRSSDPDAAFYAQTSKEISEEWSRLLAPYVPFGLTFAFNDPDMDGNGLTMWFEGREVRGIFDEQEGWITEHTGNSTYASGAVELYAVYTDGVLSGLRLATAEEQAAWDASREQSSSFLYGEEQREFPNATRADYDGILSLRTEGYSLLTLADFNQRLLDWANANPEAYDRVNCDVLWNDYAVDLTEAERDFVARTCRLSGTENGVMIRALHTGQPEQDPGFSANLPMRSDEVEGIRAAWCDLYYDLSYSISDRSTVTVGERDACVADMMACIQDFWWNTDLDTLLSMSEDDVAARFSAWAEDCSTEHVRFCQVTGDHIHYECADERQVYDEIYSHRRSEG